MARRSLISARFDAEGVNLSNLQRDVAAAGHAALTVIRRRIEFAEPELRGRAGVLPGAEATLRRLMAGDPEIIPAFLVAGTMGHETDIVLGNALPADVEAAAFTDGAKRPVVLLTTRLDFRAMAELSPALALMAVAQRSAHDVHLDAGSLFQAMSAVVSPGVLFPDWEIVQGRVHGARLHGFGLLVGGVRPVLC